MQYLYNIILYISENLLKVFGNFFGAKVRQFKNGQSEVWQKLSKCKNLDQPVIWVHVSSLGEYEQALPVIESLKSAKKKYAILLSFFSPSGYEIIKNNSPADCTVYLPLDTTDNAKKFVELVKPQMAIFVKYDLWPNYLRQLQIHKISVFLISATFNKKHPFLKYNWLRKILHNFAHIFVQDQTSQNILNGHGIQQVTLAGDTRFDRVFQLVQNNKNLSFVHRFKAGKPLLVAGSTWPKDEELLIKYINQTNFPFKTILAPHEINETHIQQIVKQLQVPYILYSDIDENTNLEDFKVMILNTIGVLKYIYAYADVVYIGNGFGKSIHNVQEPAVYGVPIITGPHIHQFEEAKALKKLGALMTIESGQDLSQTLDSLWQNPQLRQEKAQLTKNYVSSNLGATQKIINHLKKYL